MADINLRKRALEKAGYGVVSCQHPTGFHLRLPDGEYLLEPISCLPDWFASEDLAWRAAPNVEESLDVAYAVFIGKPSTQDAQTMCKTYAATGRCIWRIEGA